MRFFFVLLSICAVLISLTGCESSSGRVVAQATSLQIPPPVSADNQKKDSQVDYVVVQKSDRVMVLWKGGRIVKTYPILAFGADPIGAKVREGDEKTPEGTYYIDDKHPSQNFQKFLKISYPNEDDKLRARQLGFKPGGNVGIHGDRGGVAGFFQRFDKNWTDGCLAMRNADIAEIYDMVEIGTPIMIKP